MRFLTFVIAVLALMGLNACQTVSNGSLEVGQCITSPGGPVSEILDKGESYYVFTFPMINPPAGLGIPIEQVDKFLTDGDAVVTDCVPAEQGGI